MKRIKYLQILLLSVLIFTAGCTDRLDENPKSLIVPANFYQSDADFLAAINGTIFPIYNGYGNFTNIAPYILSAGAEDVTSRPTAPELTQYDKFQATLTGTYLSGFWQNFYQTINSANAVIEKLPLATSVKDANKQLYEANVRYFRALSYFFLTRWFGEVPIVTPEYQGVASTIVQSPVADIYKLIIDDLTFAETNLPAAPSAKGSPSKGAAKAMLAEAYLNMAGWPLKDATKYALARDKAKEVIDMGIYTLEPNFADLWINKNKLTNKEFIFCFYGSSLYGGIASHLHQSSRPGEENGWNDAMSEARFFNVFPVGPRKDATFWTVFADKGHTTWQNSSIGQPYSAKWRDAGAAASFTQAAVGSTNGDGFYVVNRYAEVLLTYAEAANMAEGAPSTAATDAINLVRRRAGGNNQLVYADLPYGMTKAAFDDAVIAERAWEFAFENKRWFDLVRKEMVVAANKDLYPWVDSHNQLLPKPQIEIDLVPGLIQNPGY